MDPNSPERVAFVSRALKWSSGGSGKLGHPRLHQLLALTLWKGRHGIPSSQQLNPLCVCLLISGKKPLGRTCQPVFQHFCFGSRFWTGTSTGHKGPLGHDIISFPVSVLVFLPGHLLLFPQPPIPPPPSSVYLHTSCLHWLLVSSFLLFSFEVSFIYYLAMGCIAGMPTLIGP